MQSNFGPIDNAVCCDFDVKAPAGLFFDLSEESRSLHLISHGNSDGPLSVQLNPQNDAHSFVARFLNDDPYDRGRHGLALGPVEVEVDFSVTVSSNVYRSQPGDVYQSREHGLVLVASRLNLPDEGAHIPIGKAKRGIALDAIAIFPHWRLVQRTQDGIREMFVRTPPFERTALPPRF